MSRAIVNPTPVTTRVSPVRRVVPILSRYSRIWIVRLRPTPDRSLKAAAVNAPSGNSSASSRAISASRSTVSGKKKRLSAILATRPRRSARRNKRSVGSGSSPSEAAISRTRGGRNSPSASKGRTRCHSFSSAVESRGRCSGNRHMPPSRTARRAAASSLNAASIAASGAAARSCAIIAARVGPSASGCVRCQSASIASTRLATVVRCSRVIATGARCGPTVRNPASGASISAANSLGVRLRITANCARSTTPVFASISCNALAALIGAIAASRASRSGRRRPRRGASGSTTWPPANVTRAAWSRTTTRSPCNAAIG